MFYMAHISFTRKTKSNAQTTKAAKSVAVSAKKNILIEKKIKKAVSAPQNKQRNVKSVELKLKAKSPKSEKPASVKKSNVVAASAKKKSIVSLPVAKPKSKTIGTKASAVKKVSIKSSPAKDSVKKSKSVKPQKTDTQKKKPASAKSPVQIKKKVSAKSSSTVSAKKANSGNKKAAPKTVRSVAVKSAVKASVISAAKKTKPAKPAAIVKAVKSIKSKPIAPRKKIEPEKVKTQAPSKKLKVETAKSKETTSAAKTVKSKPAKVAFNKKQKTKSIEEFGINTRKYSLLRKEKPQPQTENPKVANKEVKANTNNISPNDKKLIGKNLQSVKAIDDQKTELKNTPLEPETIASKLKKKKAKAIGAAVFRGKKERYDFEVFPIDGEFEDVSAIYIISKRKIDKRKRAHHALVCIGQTDSLVAELKKHRKGKCVKKFAANSISLLREANEKQRLKIETDLKAAHAIPCVHT
jgi:hypothetical protein